MTQTSAYATGTQVEIFAYGFTFTGTVKSWDESRVVLVDVEQTKTGDDHIKRLSSTEMMVRGIKAVHEASA